MRKNHQMDAEQKKLEHNYRCGQMAHFCTNPCRIPDFLPLVLSARASAGLGCALPGHLERAVCRELGLCREPKTPAWSSMVGAGVDGVTVSPRWGNATDWTAPEYLGNSPAHQRALRFRHFMVRLTLAPQNHPGESPQELQRQTIRSSNGLGTKNWNRTALSLRPRRDPPPPKTTETNRLDKPMKRKNEAVSHRCAGEPKRP